MSELQLKKAELAELLQANKELKRSKASGEEGREELLAHIVKLEYREKELTSQQSAANTNNGSNQDKIALL